MTINQQSFKERIERDIARLRACEHDSRDSLLFYVLGYVEGFQEAGAISQLESAHLIQRAHTAAVYSLLEPQGKEVPK